MNCPHCGMPDSLGCDDISLAPGLHGRSNRCFMREISNLRFEIADLRGSPADPGATASATHERPEGRCCDCRWLSIDEAATRVECEGPIPDVYQTFIPASAAMTATEATRVRRCDCFTPREAK